MVEQSSFTWSDEDRQQIANTVLAHIRAGLTQVEAFNRLSEMYPGRTPGAIGFVWNNQLRKHYRREIQEAKEEGRQIRKQQQIAARLPDDVLTAEPLQDSPDDVSERQEYVDFIIPDIAIGLVSNVLVQLEEMNQQMSRAIRYLQREIDHIKTRF